MEQRHLQSGFVAGAYVFPGGRVDPEDAIDPARCVGLDEASASACLGLTTGGLAHFVAAVRECFEEAGVLLAYDRTGQLLDFSDPAVEAHYKATRTALNAGTITMQAVAERDDLRLATDRIAYWSHWITPLGEPKRYDTRFFVTRAPANQLASHDDWELTHSAWVSPEEAMARARRGEWQIIFPTFKSLESLARHQSADEAVDWARRQPGPLPANQPRIYQDRVVLPGDPGYELGDEDIRSLDPTLRRAAFLP